MASAQKHTRDDEPELVHDILGLVSDQIPGGLPSLVTVRAWTSAERQVALKWAATEHLAASDNAVTRVPLPAHLSRGVSKYPERAQLSHDQLSRVGVGYVRLIEAMESAAHAGRVTWLDNEAGVHVAAIIPAADVHEPGTCCCKNCPWKGDHG